MNSSFVRRLEKELREFDDPNKKISLKLVGDDYTNLIGEISGPKDTPYDGGKFSLEIKITNEYPFSPPKVRFITKIWHPNISSVTGAICLDKDNALTIKPALKSLIVLLGNPVPENTLDTVIGNQYIKNRNVYIKTARHWTNVYAGSDITAEPEYAAMVKQYADDHRCTSEEALVWLSNNSWDYKPAKLANAQTALHTAATGDSFQLEKILNYNPELKYSKDWNDNTLLMHAAVGDHDKVVKLLLGNNYCDLRQRNSFGETALDLARRYKSQSVERILSEALKKNDIDCQC